MTYSSSLPYRRRAVENAWERIDSAFPAILVTGPRQVGKSTLLRHLAGPDRPMVTLDDHALRELARKDPRLFFQRFPPPVVVDEIQYAPELFVEAKILIDRDRRPGMFWFTGSQQFSLMKGVTESLAGRIAIVPLLGLSRREALGLPFRAMGYLPGRPEDLADPGDAPPGDSGSRSIMEAVWKGSFPELVLRPGIDREVFLRSYVATYLERDVRDLAQVGDLQTFARFLRAAAARTGGLLNLSDLARDADVSVPTAKRWLSILVAGSQVTLLQPYHSNVSKRLVKAPKLYFLDTGLACYLTGWTSPESMAAGAMGGALFETWVVAEIVKSWQGCAAEPRLYYYRDKDQREIDLLLERDGRLHPVEIKLSASPRREWASAFGRLASLGLSVGAGAVVCLADQPIPLGVDVLALPASRI